MQGKIVQLVSYDKKVEKRTPQTEDSGALVHEPPTFRYSVIAFSCGLQGVPARTPRAATTLRTFDRLAGRAADPLRPHSCGESVAASFRQL